MTDRITYTSVSGETRVIRLASKNARALRLGDSPAAQRDARDADWYRDYCAARDRPDYLPDALDTKILLAAHELRGGNAWGSDAFTNATLLWDRLGAGTKDTQLALRILRHVGMDLPSILESYET